MIVVCAALSDTHLNPDYYCVCPLTSECALSGGGVENDEFSKDIMIIAPAFSSALHTDREDPEVEVHPCQFQSETGTYILIIINNHAIRSRFMAEFSTDTHVLWSTCTPEYSSGFDTVHSCLCPGPWGRRRMRARMFQVYMDHHLLSSVLSSVLSCPVLSCTPYAVSVLSM